jgi:hypothetical protein
VSVDDSQVLDFGLFKVALFWLQIELMVAHMVENLLCYVSMFIQGASEDLDVIEINRDDSLCDKIQENLIHHSLESGLTIGETM